MTVVHEAAHALDCALRGGVYRSGIDPAIRQSFAAARGFVTPYAASGIDEYFAESVRAYVGANDARCPWQAVSPRRLRDLDPTMCAIIETIFAQHIAGEQLALLNPLNRKIFPCKS